MSTDLTILRILAEAPDAPLYGLQIVERSEGGVGRGSVYVHLSRLEDEGHVRSELEPVTTVPGLARRRYSITSGGRRALAARECSGMPNLAAT